MGDNAPPSFIVTQTGHFGHQLLRRCSALRKKRQSKARSLSAAIEKELQQLGLPDSRFGVHFEEVAPRPSGADAIEFEFAPNLGEDRQNLRQTASSGEMSRVMLATKTVLAAHDRIPLLVFDEIDSNVGGETASAVGKKLAELSVNHQVICITHFPQVAVQGKSHLQVLKSVEGGRTRSVVVRLENEDRVEEIARMLGGRTLTSMTLDHAREMLHLAHEIS